MPTYSCELCSKVFSKKTDYTRHKNRKISCVEKPIEEIIEEKVEECIAKRLDETKTESKDETKDETKSVGVILNLVQNLHDLTRSKAAITGQKAYYDIIRLLLLRFMEPHIKPNGRLADLLNPKNYSNIVDFNPEYIKYLHFTELVSSTDVDFEDRIYLVWSMLSLYSFTNPVFPKNKAFNSPPNVLELACKKIYKTLENINFDDLNEDVGGAIYEHFVNKKGGGGGQSLGQYFTPRKLIQLIMRLNHEVFPEHKTPTNIYDPCAGTAGFLMEMYKATKVNPEEIYGGELEPDTFANCLMNIMLTTGSVGNVKNGDSFKNNSLKKYDWIGTNPPFGIKKLKYEDILANVEFKDAVAKRGSKTAKACIPATEMYPIKTTDGSALFLQHCIAKLANNGMCNIVLPAGQLITGKNAYAKIRQHLIEECILQAVLSVPGGVFDNAGVSTVVLFFTKSKDSCTGDVDFYETNQACVSFKKLGTVHSEDLAEKNYVLDWKCYKQTEVLAPVDSTWEIKTLGEVCEYLPKRGLYQSKDGNAEGRYRFYTCAETIKYVDECHYNEPCLIVNRNGYAMVRTDDNFSAEKDHIYVLKVSKHIELKFIYYYLNTIISQMNDLMTGVGIKNITKEKLNAIQIPVPSLEKQQEICAKCEEYDCDIQSTKKLIEELELSKKTFSKVYVEPLFKAEEVKTLGDICEIKQGTYIKKENKQEGEFPVYGGGNQSGTHISYNCEDAIIVAKDGVSEKCVRYIKGKFFLNHHAWRVVPLENISDDYLKYFLFSNQENIYSLASGAAQKGINQEQFNSLQIPVPSLEKQQEIVKKYDVLYTCIDNHRTLINELETQKNQYLKNSFNSSSDD